MYLTRLKAKQIRMVKGRSCVEKEATTYFILPELWQIIKEFLLDWKQHWKRLIKPVHTDIHFTIKCLKTGRFGRFVDSEDKVSFNHVAEKFICSTNSLHLPRVNLRIRFCWSQKGSTEEKAIYKQPFIRLNEQAGEYWTCYYCIYRELEYFSRPFDF